MNYTELDHDYSLDDEYEMDDQDAIDALNSLENSHPFKLSFFNHIHITLASCIYIHIYHTYIYVCIYAFIHQWIDSFIIIRSFLYF